MSDSEECEYCGGRGMRDVEAAVDAVERLSPIELVKIDEGVVAAVPTGKGLVDLMPFVDARRDNPKRRMGTSQHTTLESFIEHNARTRDAHSVIFGQDNPTAPELLAIYDYNESTVVRDYERATTNPDGTKNYDGIDSDGLPRFGAHRARYAMPFSDEWLVWMKIAGPSAGWLGQLDFAQALEDRGLEVVAPSDIPTRTAKDVEALGIVAAGPSTLMNLARGLLVRADRKVGSAHNLNSGEGKITFEETHTATVNDAPVIVPNGFVVSIPVFRDGSPYALIVRLRYRVDGAQIKWKLAVHRADVCFRDAFYEVAKSVKDKTGLPLFYGTPEWR
jgi:hypothetical protein